MKRFFSLLILLTSVLSIKSEVKIISNKMWNPTLTGNWSYAPELTYTNTAYGDTYYNSGWQDMAKSTTISSKAVWRYFYLKPSTPQSWKFTLPVTNLNAEPGHLYYAQKNPKLKQSADQIYWSIVVGYKADGVARTFTVWIRRNCVPYNPSGYIAYNIDNTGWKDTPTRYPSCSREYPPYLVVDITRYEYNSRGNTSIKWGSCSLTTIPVYIEEITYVKIQVGTQAKIQLGKPSASGQYIRDPKSNKHMEEGNYMKAKSFLYRSDQTYYENQAFNLAICYAVLREYYNALDMCNALIKFNGERLYEAYRLRAMVNEDLGRLSSALEDYKSAGDYENYNRLYNQNK